MMQPRIIQRKDTKCIGQSLFMSLVNNRTGELWRSFMPMRGQIQNRVGTDFISLQVYPPEYHSVFTPEREFMKYALVEVLDYNSVPEGMETFTIAGGLYALFDYKGESGDPSIFHYIYGDWIPKSKFVLDNRPHFEVLGANYENNNPNSEEKIWIPIKEA
jgi:AraC family transcriptional regulator